MVDLGRPDNFADAQGVVDLIKIEPQFVGGPLASAELNLFATDGSPLLYRVRFVSVEGLLDGTVGSCSLTFQGLTAGGSGPEWPTGGPLVASSDKNIGFRDTYHYTWNTEISDNYSNFEANFGTTWVGGLPMLYLPKLTDFSVLFTSIGGYDGDFQIDTGHMQIERFAPETVLGENAQERNADVYLLPQVA